MIQDTIPCFCSLYKLTSLYLDSNRLTGTVPGLSGLTDLEYFAIFNNDLTGTMFSKGGYLGCGLRVGC